MPLTKKGKKVKKAMEESYAKKGKSKKEADAIFYASENKGTIKGVSKKKKKKSK